MLGGWVGCAVERIGFRILYAASERVVQFPLEFARFRYCTVGLSFLSPAAVFVAFFSGFFFRSLKSLVGQSVTSCIAARTLVFAVIPS